MTTPILACRGCTRYYNLAQIIRPCSQTARIELRVRPATAQRCGRRFASTGVKAVPPKTKPTTITQSSPLSPAKIVPAPNLSFAQKLADKSVPTTLYEAGPQGVFLFSSYTAGLFFVAAAGINIYVNVYNAPEGIHWIVPVAFGTMGVLLAAFGTRFALMPANSIRCIKVLPNRPVGAPAPAPASKAAAPASLPVRLEIEARSSIPLPGLPLRRIRADPRDVVLRVPMYTRRPAPSDYEKMAQRRREEAARKREREYEMDHLMTAPFRHARKAFAGLFASFRRGITGEGFAPVTVNGQRYKLDVTAAYALEDGRALDRLVRIEQMSPATPRVR